MAQSSRGKGSNKDESLGVVLLERERDDVRGKGVREEIILQSSAL